MRVELNDVHTEVGNIRTELTGMREEQDRMDKKLSQIIETVAPELEKREYLKSRVDGHDTILAAHSLRLQKLESRTL